MFFLVVVSYVVLVSLLSSGLLVKSPLTSAFQFRTFTTYVVLVWVSVIISSSLLTGNVPFNFIFGSAGLFVFILAWGVWFSSFFASSLLKLRLHLDLALFVFFLFMFDTFVVLLRPVTLTLRVFINVSLGHFLMAAIHLSLLWVLFLVFLIESFVFIVQTFVFLTLSKSYLESLSHSALSSVKNAGLTNRSLMSYIIN